MIVQALSLQAKDRMLSGSGTEMSLSARKWEGPARPSGNCLLNCELMTLQSRLDYQEYPAFVLYHSHVLSEA